jgi:hypothetical protein
MYAACVFQITVLLVPLDLFSGMLHELIKLLISAQLHLIRLSQGRAELSLFMPQMRMMNVRYSSSQALDKGVQLHLLVTMHGEDIVSTTRVMSIQPHV